MKVRLERVEVESLQRQMQDFNSMKVRLEPARRARQRPRCRFQFHEGTIGTMLDLREILVYSLYFNSMKVRLEQSELANNDAVSKFQFHEGTIGTFFQHLRRQLIRDFNSMKVRLERSGRKSTFPGLKYFNSMKVRLELFDMAMKNCDAEYFNSMKVRLERILFSGITFFRMDFNSMKVRLEQNDAILMTDCRKSFQFHEGTIGTFAALAPFARHFISIP